MAKKSTKERTYFRREGVIVHHPGQPKPVRVERLPMPALSTMKSATGGFTPIRPVINLRLRQDDGSNKEVSVFEPPIKLRVRYTIDDINAAKKAGGSISMAFWDGTDWIRFTEAKHDYMVLVSKPTKKYAGWLVVSLSQWGDPPIIVGT